MFVTRLLRLFSVPLPTPTPERIAAARRKLFQSCRACGKTLDSHSWWRLASAVLREDSNAAESLAALVAAREWEQAARIRQWEGSRDEREYYLVRCPNTKTLSLVTVASLAEMYFDDYVEASEILDERDSSVLTAIAGDRWRSF